MRANCLQTFLRSLFAKFSAADALYLINRTEKQQLFIARVVGIAVWMMSFNRIAVADDRHSPLFGLE